MKNKKSFGFPMMEEMTVQTVRQYLEKKNSVILPVGIIEQHGYHLPIITDALTAREMAKMVAKKTGILVAPVLYSSFSGGGLSGTINISPSVMSLVINDTLVSLASQGFKKIYIFLGHGGGENLNVLEISLKVLLRNNPIFSDVVLALFPVWSFDESGRGWKKAVKEKDWHAGWLETSMMMALAPHLVHMEEMKIDKKPDPSIKILDPDSSQQAEKIVDDPMVIPRMRQRPDIKVGVIGNPAKASAKLGKELVRQAVSIMVKKISEIERQYDGKYKVVHITPYPPLM